MIEDHRQTGDGHDEWHPGHSHRCRASVLVIAALFAGDRIVIVRAHLRDFQHLLESTQECR